MTLEECKIYLKKTMGYYTPTRADFTKTYHSPPKIHGLSIESVDFGWSPHGVHGNSMRSLHRLHGLHEDSMRTLHRLYEDSMRSLHKLHGLHEDSMRTP